MGKTQGTGKVSPFRQPPPSSISSLGPVVVLQLLPCVPLLQTCRASSNSHLSGIRFRTNVNERTSKVSCIVLLPSTYGTELIVLYLKPWAFLSSDICWDSGSHKAGQQQSRRPRAVRCCKKTSFTHEAMLWSGKEDGFEKTAQPFFHYEYRTGSRESKCLFERYHFPDQFWAIYPDHVIELLFFFFFLMESKMTEVLFSELRIYSSLPRLVS